MRLKFCKERKLEYCEREEITSTRTNNLRVISPSSSIRISIGLTPKLPFINMPIQIKLGSKSSERIKGLDLLIAREEIISLI